MLLLFTMYHCSNWTWVVEEILAFGSRLRSVEYIHSTHIQHTSLVQEKRPQIQAMAAGRMPSCYLCYWFPPLIQLCIFIKRKFTFCLDR